MDPFALSVSYREFGSAVCVESLRYHSVMCSWRWTRKWNRSLCRDEQERKAEVSKEDPFCGRWQLGVRAVPERELELEKRV